jgi:hypothetical protein
MRTGAAIEITQHVRLHYLENPSTPTTNHDAPVAEMQTIIIWSQTRMHQTMISACKDKIATSAW